MRELRALMEGLGPLAIGVIATILGCFKQFWPGKNPRGDAISRMVLRLIGVAFLVIGISYLTFRLNLPPWRP
jgi:hypothetical protein